MEIWKEVKGFPAYKVSNYGNVKRIKQSKNKHKLKKQLKRQVTKKGYERVYLYTNSLRYCMPIHHLVLTHFDDKEPEALQYYPRPEGLECNHKDGDKRNNYRTNLEWCTGSQNVQHAVSMGLRTQVGESVGTSKLKEKEVLGIIKLDGTHSASEIAKIYNVSPGAVHCITSGRTWGWLTGRSLYGQ